MKTKFLFVITALLLSSSVTLIAFGATGLPIDPSPTGLEAHYPPKADGPVYLFRMLDLERAFSGMAAELMENDLAGARELYGEFAAKYHSVKGMVEEWKEYFPEEEVETLGRALQGTDREAMFRSLEGMGERCHRCHAATMVITQQKYRWGDFSSLVVNDEKNGQTKPYGVFKKFIAANMAGVEVDAEQGQWENAREHFGALKKRLTVLSETCQACHAEKPGYFTEAKALGSLEEEIGRDQPDKRRVSALLNNIGAEACAGCHLIHVPAAMRTAVVR